MNNLNKLMVLSILCVAPLHGFSQILMPTGLDKLSGGVVETTGMLMQTSYDNLQIYDDTLFAATRNGVFAYSLKQKNGWESYAFQGQPISFFVKNGPKMMAIRVDESRERSHPNLWAADFALLRSSDGGATFFDCTPAFVSDNPDKVLMTNIAIAGSGDVYLAVFTTGKQRLFTGNDLTGGSTMLYVSNDDGDHWAENGPNTGNQEPYRVWGSVAVRQGVDRKVLLYGANTLFETPRYFLYYSFGEASEFDVLRIGDTTETEPGTTDPQTIYSTIFHPQAPDRMLLLTERGVFATDDSFKSGRYLTTGLPTIGKTYYLYALAVSETNPSRLYVVGKRDATEQKDCLYCSDDNGETWQLALELETTDITSLHLYGDDLYMGGNGEVYHLNVQQLPTNIGQTGSASATEPAPVCDLQGRRLVEEPQKGVYVKGGKKYVK
ncbi:MAG: hypothetical protein IJ196_00635 [Prevotella sp.]|nr:hypothetical protein [Prevotella sp.]